MFSAATIRAMAKRYNVEIVGELRTKKQKFYYIKVIKTFIELDNEADVEEPTYNYGAGYDLLNNRVFNAQLYAELQHYIKNCHYRFQCGSIDWIRQEFQIMFGSKVVGYVSYSHMRQRFIWRLNTDGFMVSRTVKNNTLTEAIDALTSLYISQLSKVAS